MFRAWNERWHFPTYTNGFWGHEWDFGKFSFFIKHKQKARTL
jgi:hypothetical protein